MVASRLPKILIVDDTPTNIDLLSATLGDQACELMAATSGARALELAARDAPDLVLLDVMMPGKNGWDVAKELRADEQFSNVGIVMLTAIGEKVNEMTSPLYGADAYVDKPFDFSDLEKKIKDVLSERAKRS